MPQVGAAAPGRVNLIGEHVDYNDGFVLPMAIDRRAVAVASAGGRPGWIRIVSEQQASCVEMPAESLFDPKAWSRGRLGAIAWAAYVAGGLAEGAKLAGDAAAAHLPHAGLDIAVTSDVPLGAGLSSSAALEVAAALCGWQLARRVGAPSPQVGAPEPTALARACQRAEHRYAGVPCGIMDQLTSVCGRADHALLIDCRDLTITPVPFPPNLAIIVIDTGVRHELAAGEYAARRAACERAAAAIGAASLRDATEGALASASGRLTNEESACARHVLSENARTLAAADALRAADGPALGRLMLASHASLRDDYRVSCRELDEAVAAATATPGVYGARMTGGGFGGSAIALVPADHADAALASIASEYARRVGAPCRAWVVRAAGGAVTIGSERA